MIWLFGRMWPRRRPKKGQLPGLRPLSFVDFLIPWPFWRIVEFWAEIQRLRHALILARMQIEEGNGVMRAVAKSLEQTADKRGH